MYNKNVPSSHFISTLTVNLDNEKLNDENFKIFVGNSLEIVDHTLNKNRQHQNEIDTADILMDIISINLATDMPADKFRQLTKKYVEAYNKSFELQKEHRDKINRKPLKK